MATEHKTRVQKGWRMKDNSAGETFYTRIYRACCSCGFEDVVRETEDEAAGDAELHDMVAGA